MEERWIRSGAIGGVFELGQEEGEVNAGGRHDQWNVRRDHEKR